MREPVVVGVDGSTQALLAVDWAAAEAGCRRLPLRIVHVSTGWERGDIPAYRGRGAPSAEPESPGLRVLDAAEERARTFTSVPIERRLGVGPVPRTLLEESAGGVLLVLGQRSSGTLTRLLLGSVSRQAAEHAGCPVVVVPMDPDRRARRPEIAVGVDGSDASIEAVGFALEEAALRGVGLRAIHVWNRPDSPPDMRPVCYNALTAEEEGARVLSESLAGWRAKYPDVPVTEQVIEDRPVTVLAEASRTAELLVVGARGRGGFPGLRLGSVGHAVLHHAKGPVAVVRRTGHGAGR
ncbi:universal stress protein [Actinoallomurus rhizosphaericola]|uniref:universal stress protein n=1 Tax=Actinoallomurus rhizosphaericola TaxID=2952536 RepID=UPI002093E22A|nr:universal stress protein [Actinoallomurus rhizosphaericola]MCO5995590.1 universal stress protein [Actinoallomurus rhizosphaericola]